MLGTLFSILLAILLQFYPFGDETSFTYVAAVMVASAFLFILMIPLGTLFSLLPLQKAEQNSAPRVVEMFRNDELIRFTNVWLAIVALISFAAAFDLLYQHLLNPKLLMMAWIILFGFTLDLLRGSTRRVLRYLNPYMTVELFSKEAKKCIQNDRELDLCHWIDSLSEVAIKGIQRQSTSISNLALEEQQNIASLFLDASKSIGHQSQDRQTKELGITDKVSYTMFYLYQRLDVTFEKALKHRLEMVCSHIITVFGKLTISAAKYDVSMASAPLRFLGKCAKRAQDEGMEETAITASCTFSEVAKTLLSEIDVTYYEIKDPFLSIINGMEVLAKGAFKRDKTINIKLLAQPFKELKALFENDKLKEHQDTPVIMQNIDRVLGEFEALQQVMIAMPPIPSDTSS